jgi:protein-S-isoprenylcysteine O-methyltransferase Ste14
MKKRLERLGLVLFRFRSYIPVVTLPFFYLLLDGTLAPLHLERITLGWGLGCLVLSLCGSAIRISVLGRVPLGTSGRNARSQVAEVLNTSGLYSIVRHPLYVGNFFIFLGVSLFPRVGWAALLLMAVFCLFYLPIVVAEDNFLAGKFGAAHDQWRARTPAVIPLPWRWRRWDGPFSVRTVLQRDHQTVFAIVFIFALLELLAHYGATGGLRVRPVFGAIFAVAVVGYLAVRIPLRGARWLHLPRL